jgi:hypothetical protein
MNSVAEQLPLIKTALKCQEIQNKLFHEHDKGGAIICFNSTKALRHEADVLVLRKSGVTLEFEIKVSYADFLADFRKVEKHQQMQSGDTGGPQYFFYACEPGVIPPEKVPAYAGLVHVQRHYFPNRTNTYIDHKDVLTVVKEAPRLHREVNEGIHERLCRALMYKAYYNV